MTLQKKKAFISLKWKYALIISSVIVLLYVILSWGLYQKSNSDFEEQLHVQQLNNINVLSDLINNSGQVMEQLVDSLIQFKLGKGNINSNEELTHLIKKYWPNLQITWGLSNISFYQSDSETLFHLGIEKPELNLLNLKVLTTERPHHAIVCQTQCLIYAAVPVLIQGKLEGVISIGKSIADTLIFFENLTQADIGLWNNNIIPAITNEKNTRPLLKNLLSKKQIKPRKVGDTNIQISQTIYNKQHYSISFSPVELDSNASFIIINHLEHAYQQLQNERVNIIITGLTSLLVTLILLFYLLEKSLKRIDHLLLALPFLSTAISDKYKHVKEILSQVRASKFGFDELDQLRGSFGKLSDQLESLENDSISKNIALKKERDFIHQLIETAPVYIITQDLSGKIISANNQCSRLLGMKNDEIIEQSFDEMFTKKDSSHIQLLKSFRENKSSKMVNIDDELITSFSGNNFISWIHSFINNDSGQQDNILSLGIDITERKLAEDQTLWIASHDPLTNLHNRRYFQNEFEKILTLSERYDNKVALFYLDLDQFKIVNDTQGHDSGDKLLIQVANSLSKISRKSDLLCRLGGDEFAIVTPINDMQGVEALAEKINHSMKDIIFQENVSYQVGFSVGVALYPEHGQSIHELLTNADLAMYKSKETGFNQYHIYNPKNNYHQEINKKLEWKQLIETAIAENWLTLYYQPILDLQTQTISHYECLLRIVKSDGEMMGPAEFIQYSEKLGLIESIDILVINLAIKQHLALQKNGKEHLKLAINLSGRSINSDKVKDEIKILLQRPEVCSEKIIFEITETSAVTNFSSAQNFISEIRELGCQVALDDFGTGFSSFYYLKNMSFDYIKIDGAFIKRIDSDKEDKIFVKALSDVARALGKKTIAEFVESEQIVTILKELKIDYAQGYHISKPLPKIH